MSQYTAMILFSTRGTYLLSEAQGRALIGGGAGVWENR